MCLDEGFTSADRWGLSMLSPHVEMLSFEACVYMSVHACLRILYTHKHISELR